MSEWGYSLCVSVAWGMVLGGLYFGGLWLTVSSLPDTRRPVLWMGGSFVLRSTLVMAGFYLVMEGQWQRLLACLAGFLVVRLFLVRRLARPVIGLAT